MSLSKLISVKDNWVLPLSDAEVVMIFATLKHCANYNIHATKEEKLQVLDWLQHKAMVEMTLDDEMRAILEKSDVDPAHYKKC